MRILIKFILGILTLYFCLIWAKTLPAPTYLQSEMEPLIAVIGAILFLFSLFEESITHWFSPKKINIRVLEARLYNISYLLDDTPNLRNLSLSLWIENHGDRDILINTVKVYPINAKVSQDVVYEHENDDLNNTIPVGRSKNIKINISPPQIGFPSLGNFRLEIDFIGGKSVAADFVLSE